MFIALRWVAMVDAWRVPTLVWMVTGWSPWSCRFVLGPVVRSAARDAVLVGTAIDGRHLGPVAVRRRGVRGPLERVRAPRVLLRLGAGTQAADEVEQEHELEEQHHHQRHGGEDAQVLQLGP